MIGTPAGASETCHLPWASGQMCGLEPGRCPLQPVVTILGAAPSSYRGGGGAAREQLVIRVTDLISKVSSSVHGPRKGSEGGG